MTSEEIAAGPQKTPTVPVEVVPVTVPVSTGCVYTPLLIEVHRRGTKQDFAFVKEHLKVCLQCRQEAYRINQSQEGFFTGLAKDAVYGTAFMALWYALTPKSKTNINTR